MLCHGTLLLHHIYSGEPAHLLGRNRQKDLLGIDKGNSF